MVLGGIRVGAGEDGLPSVSRDPLSMQNALADAWARVFAEKPFDTEAARSAVQNYVICLIFILFLLFVLMITSEQLRFRARIPPRALMGFRPMLGGSLGPWEPARFLM